MSTEPHIKLLKEARTSWLYPIYVPSYTRAGTAHLLNSLSSAPQSVKDKVHIIVRPEEYDSYKSLYSWATLVKVKQPGLGPARTRALKDAKLRGFRRIIMLDDDIRHVSLLEMVTRDNGSVSARRHSSKISGEPEVRHFIRTLAVVCKLADGVFAERPNAVYGACRNALFSNTVDTRIGATANKGTFPAAVMMYDVFRMESFELPKRFHMHGEDVAFALDVMSRGQEWFTLPVAAFDACGSIESTIPLDPQDSVARRVDIENAAKEYPDIHPYLRESVRNKAGGVMRVGMLWRRWYKDTGSEPVEIPIEKIMPKRKK